MKQQKSTTERVVFVGVELNGGEDESHVCHPTLVAMLHTSER